MAKQKRLFETALQAQQSCLEEARRLLLQAEQKARELKASDRYAEEYKREELKKLADTVTTSIETVLREAEETQSELEAAIEKSCEVEVPVEERTYNAARIGAALPLVRDVDELVSLYKSESVQSDAALRSELVRAVDLHAFGKEPVWQETLRQARPSAVKAAEAWREKLGTFTGLTRIMAQEAHTANFSLPKSEDFVSVLTSFASESEKALSTLTD